MVESYNEPRLKNNPDAHSSVPWQRASMISEKAEAARRIVFVDDAHTFGGAQIALAWGIRAIVSNTGHSVVCVCTASAAEAIRDIAGQSQRLTYVVCPKALPLNVLGFPLRILSFFRIVEKLRRQDVTDWWLNLSGIEFCLAPVIVLSALGESHTAWLHGPESLAFLMRGRTPARRLVNRVRDLLANHLLFRLHPILATPSETASEGARKRARGYGVISTLSPTVARAVGPSADLKDATEEQSQGRCVNLRMIGRIEFGHKNNVAAVDAFRALKRRGFEASLTIVGDGPDMAKLRASCRDLKASDGLRFLGWSADPWLGVAGDDVILIPSFWESLSLVAIEAMLRGVRMVTSPLEVFHEVFPQQFIAAGFSGEALADQVERVLRISRHDMLGWYAESLVRFSEERFLRTFAELSNGQTDGKNFAKATSPQ